MKDKSLHEMPSLLSRTRGCILGGALGDALGWPIEFKSLAEIRDAYGPAGLQNLVAGIEGLSPFTDDTQMSLFVAEGHIRYRSRGQEDVDGGEMEASWHALQRWYATQQGEQAYWQERGIYNGWLFAQKGLHVRMAPGNTCLTSLYVRDAGSSTHRINKSKGCGGVMRVAPIGLLQQPAPRFAFDMAVANAALTHGHPSGFLAAGHFAYAIRMLTSGYSLAESIGRATAVLETWDPKIEADDTLRAVDAALRLAAGGPPSAEALETLGGGWVAEEALAIAYYCALSHPADVKTALRLAVNHSGDSDSTGAMTGNLLGALLGEATLPQDWLGALSLAHLVADVATDLYQASNNPFAEENFMSRYP